jgi:hypothetical protein
MEKEKRVMQQGNVLLDVEAENSNRRHNHHWVLHYADRDELIAFGRASTRGKAIELGKAKLTELIERTAGYDVRMGIPA